MLFNPSFKCDMVVPSVSYNLIKGLGFTLGLHFGLIFLFGLPLLYMCYFERKYNPELINYQTPDSIYYQGWASYICCALFLLLLQEEIDSKCIFAMFSMGQNCALTFIIYSRAARNMDLMKIEKEFLRIKKGLERRILKTRALLAKKNSISTKREVANPTLMSNLSNRTPTVEVLEKRLDEYA